MCSKKKTKAVSVLCFLSRLPFIPFNSLVLCHVTLFRNNIETVDSLTGKDTHKRYIGDAKQPEKKRDNQKKIHTVYKLKQTKILNTIYSYQ